MSADALRLATEPDLDEILEIVAQAQAYLAKCGVDQWQDGYPNRDVMLDDIRLCRGYVLQTAGGIVGIATIVFDGEPSYDVIEDGAWTTPVPYACIHRIAVSAAMRGTGVSARLMRAAEDVIAAGGVTSVRIDTHRDNRAMQGMLARNGYRRCGVIYLRNGNERGAARIALEKTLIR